MEVTKLNEIDDDLSVESSRLDTILQVSPKEVQDAVSGKKALADKRPRKGRLSVKLSSKKQESSFQSIVDRFE